MELQHNVALAPYTTLGVGGPARLFATVTTEEEIAEAVSLAQQQHLPLFVLGGGSNLLVADNGFDGLVLHIALPGIRSSPLPDGRVLLQVGAGESWDGLVQYTVERDLAGMECLAGIPGTVGGTPIQNVGAYGQEVADTIVALRCFDTRSSEMVELSAADCNFGYRTSVLNSAERGRFVVTRVDFALTAGGEPTLQYADLRNRFPEGTRPSLAEVAAAVRDIRRGKGMVVDPAEPNSRSAGSFFRNPVVAAHRLVEIARAAGVPAEQVPHWPAADGCVKLPAAWLLERAGFVRGYVLGKAGISARHTLALINRGGASACDVVALRDHIVDGVQQRFGLRLQQEPVSLGDVAAACE